MEELQEKRQGSEIRPKEVGQGLRDLAAGGGRVFARMAGEALDLLYPPALYCICCGKIIDESRPYRLCNDCMDGIKWATGRTCLRCGKPLSAMNPYDWCYNCREHPHRFDRGFTCAEYGEHERALVFAMKYDGRSDIAGTLAEILHDRLELLRSTEDWPGYDLIVPVPMHRPKERERGYNQAVLMARELSRLERRPWDPDLICRNRETKAMRGLSPEERKNNIRGAFELSPQRFPAEAPENRAEGTAEGTRRTAERTRRTAEGARGLTERMRGSAEPAGGKHFARSRKAGRRPIAGQRILILDDLYTTGATADEMTEVLRAAGAREVYILSFAAGADLVV